MDSSKYISLLVKKFKGKLGHQEADTLNDWQSSNDRNISEKQLKKVWELSSQYKGGYEPDVEAGLARFKNRLKEESKVIEMPRRRFNLAWAAAIAVLMVALGWWWKSTSTTTLMTMATSADEQREVQLPDGSLVVLNELSEIDFSEFGLSNNRIVHFSGEAYFDIEPDPEHPFIIITDKAEVKVLGTAFNLRAYQKEAFTEVEVERGRVELIEKEASERVILNANDRGVSRIGAEMTKEKVEYLNALSWRTQSLAFRNSPMEEVVPYLERHFKIEIDVKESLRQCPVTSDFNDLNLDKIFLTLERIFSAQVEQRDIKHFVIEGNGC